MARSGVRVYVAVFAALVVLTLATVAVSYVDLGPVSVVVALSIAFTKAVLVVLFFMHLRESPGLTWVVAGGALSGMGAGAAAARGRERTGPPASAAGGDLEEQVWATLKTCFDPEIPVNIVDLGLVYDMRIAPEGDGHRVDVKMTLTAPGCGMGTSIAADARLRLLDLPGVTDADVQIVWDPPWNPQMISPEGKERLGMG